MRYHSTAIRMATIKKKKQKIKLVRGDVEKLELLYIGVDTANQ